MRPTLLLLTVACCALVGCSSGSSIPPPVDPAQAREALKKTLDTWKRGGTVDELKSSNIVVRDPDWSAGAKLANYEIAPEDKHTGADLNVAVKLSLVGADGKPREKKASFTVAIGSSTVVLRDE